MTATTVHSRPLVRDGLLRLALRVDAAVSGAMGLGFAATATALDGVLGVPAGWLLGLGVIILAWAGTLTWLASRSRIRVGAASAVIALNLAWVADSVLVLLADWFPLTGVGTAFVVAQAIAVVAFAEVQYVGLRRSRAAA